MNETVAVKCITKKNLAKSQNLLSKEIKILRVNMLFLQYCGQFFTNLRILSYWDIWHRLMYH